MSTLGRLFCAAIIFFSPQALAQEQNYQRPPEDMSAPPYHPLMGFDVPCPAPTSSLFCAQKTFMGCRFEGNPRVCKAVGAEPPLEAMPGHEDSEFLGDRIYHRPWDVPFSEMTQDIFGYEIIGFRKADAKRLSGLSDYDRNRLTGTYEVMTRSADREANYYYYKYSPFFRQDEDEYWRYADSVSWTFGPPDVTICDGDNTCGSDLKGLEPW